MKYFISVIMFLVSFASLADDKCARQAIKAAIATESLSQNKTIDPSKAIAKYYTEVMLDGQDWHRKYEFSKVYTVSIFDSQSNKITGYSVTLLRCSTVQKIDLLGNE